MAARQVKLTWFHVFRKSEELENKSSSSKSTFLAYRWSRETVEGDVTTTILSNFEYEVIKTLPTHTVYTWNETVFPLLSKRILILVGDVMFGIRTCWKWWRGERAQTKTRSRDLRGQNQIEAACTSHSPELGRNCAIILVFWKWFILRAFLFCDFAKTSLRKKATTDFSAWGKNKINKKIPKIRFKKSVYNKTFGFPLSDGGEMPS